MRSITLLSLFSILFCYYCIFFTFQTSLASAKCLEDQQSLLLHLKNNFIFEYSLKLILWNQSIACCNWSGVTCDNEGHVIGLDLSREYISGGFDNSSSIFSLQHLQKLNLAYNNFNSLIPSGFNKLEKLTYLNLSFAGFQVTRFQLRLQGEIPIEISQLTRLVTLDISFPFPHVDFYLLFNKFYASRPPPKLKISNLQKFIQNLTNIRQLYLDGISITSQGHEWSNVLFPLRDLQELSMYNCNLSGPLDSSLLKLENLSVIILGENNFSSPVPETFSNFKNLTILNLQNCGLTSTFPQKIIRIRTLSLIDLSDNPNLHVYFSEYSLSKSLHSIRVSNTSFPGALPHNIGDMTNLILLDLSYCQLYGTLPYSLSNLTHLNYLDLSYNDLSGAIPSSMSNLTQLISLSLQDNNLSGAIPSYLFTLPSLDEIWLTSNKFSKFDEFINASSSVLKYLYLHNNNISGHFPTPIFQFHSLSALDLSSNRLYGQLQLDELLELRNLTELNLSYNNISIIVNDSNVDLSSIPNFYDLRLASCNLKTFPSFLRNQSRLDSLDLSNNQIQGNIPQYIGYYLPFITYLSLSNNNLLGSIPDSLCNASNLQVLDLSFNNISGTISPCLITMTSTLEALNLRKNSLNGPIPDMFPTSCSLGSLKFHENFLHGPIPKSLSNCSSLKVLDIGSNRIVGRFPCFLKNIPTLSVLVLRNNKFYGPIECSHLIENKPWKTIQIVDIAFNNFNGKLPEKLFTSWERMKHDEDVVSGNKYIQQLYSSYYQDSVTVTCKGHQMELVKILTIFVAIDFSSNFFEGPIPKVLMDFKALYVLNFSNNALSGKIPSSIGNLKQLESLDLSNNSLVGEIPEQLASMSFLSYLNLSFNHLVGKIPTGTQLQSFPTSFEGNVGLYGPPLTEKSDGKRQDLHPNPTCGRIACSVDWNFLSVELGFIFGLGIIMVPIMFWKQWRVSYWKLVDTILCWIFPWMHFEYATHRGQTYLVLRWRW